MFNAKGSVVKIGTTQSWLTLVRLLAARLVTRSHLHLQLMNVRTNPIDSLL